MDNNIQFINQLLTHLRSLIPICIAQSASAEKRLANKIIALEIKRIKAIHALENRLAELRALISVYKARRPTYEHVLAKQIINLDIQLIAAKKPIFIISTTITFSCITATCSTSFCIAAFNIAANIIK